MTTFKKYRLWGKLDLAWFKKHKDLRQIERIPFYLIWNGPYTSWQIAVNVKPHPVDGGRLSNFRVWRHRAFSLLTDALILTGAIVLFALW